MSKATDDEARRFPPQERAPCPMCDGDEPECFWCDGTGTRRGITVRALLASLAGVDPDCQVSFILHAGSYSKEIEIEWSSYEIIGPSTFYVGAVREPKNEGAMMSKQNPIKKAFLENLLAAEQSLEGVDEEVVRDWAAYGFASYLMSNSDDPVDPVASVAVIRRFVAEPTG